MFNDMNSTPRSSDTPKNEPSAMPGSRSEVSYRGVNRITAYLEKNSATHDCAEAPAPAPLKWYIALLVFECRSEEGWTDPMVDVQYCLVRATDRDAAYARALELGQEGEGTSQFEEGRSLYWTFKGL